MYSSVGIATGYRFDGPGIESRWGSDLPNHPDRPLGQPANYTRGNRIIFMNTAGGAWRSPPTPSSAEFKKRIQLYLFSPFGA
jgi:hypothetical protein